MIHKGAKAAPKRLGSAGKKAGKGHAAAAAKHTAAIAARGKPAGSGRPSMLADSAFRRAKTVFLSGSQGLSGGQGLSDGPAASGAGHQSMKSMAVPDEGAGRPLIAIPHFASSLASYCVSVTGTPGNLRFAALVHPVDSRNASGIGKSAGMDVAARLTRRHWSN